MNPLVMKLNLVNPEECTFEIYETPYSTKELQDQAKNFNPNAIEGRLVFSSDNYGLPKEDWQREAASYHLAIHGLTALGMQIGCFGQGNPKVENVWLYGIYPPKPIEFSGQDALPDFFDQLRAFEAALRGLSRYIESINDPHIKDSRMVQVKASIDACLCYIKPDDPNGPKELPGEAALTLRKYLKNID